MNLVEYIAHLQKVLEDEGNILVVVKDLECEDCYHATRPEVVGVNVGRFGDIRSLLNEEENTTRAVVIGQ